MIKFVLLDLDDTILDFRKAERSALKKSLEHFGIRSDGEILEAYSLINKQQWQLLETGRLTKEQVKTERYRILFERYGINTVSPVAMTEEYEKNLATGHYFVEGAEALLDALSRDYRLFLVTNGTKAVQVSRLESSGIYRYFESVFISEDIGYVKPQKEFFEAAFSRVEGFEKNESVIVGDSLTSDIRGGINFGIKTVWFNKYNIENETDITPDFTVNSLDEVKNIIKKL